MWDVQLDWDQDGTFSESIWQDVISMEWRLGMGRPFALVADEATCQILVRNADGKYNPENAASPYYGQMLPQVPMQILANDVVMWRGWLDTIQPEWVPAGSHTGQTVAMLSGIGAKQFLQDTHINLPLKQQQRGDEILRDVLLQVVLPPSTKRAILGKIGYAELGENTYLGKLSDYAELDTGIRTFRYYGDIRNRAQSRSQTDGYRIIKDITDAERGRFFFRRDAKAVWWNQDNLLDSVTLDGTVSESGAVRPMEIGYSYGQGIVNRVRVIAYPRKAGNTIVLWSLDQPLIVPAGGSITFEAPFTDSDDRRAGALSAVLENVIFAAGDATIGITRQAERATLTLANTGSEDAVLTSLDITGQVLTSQNQIVIQAEDAESIKAYGVRGEMKLNLHAIDNAADAQTIARWELERRSGVRGTLQSLTFRNAANGIDNAHQLAWTMGTRLALDLPGVAHHAEYHVIGEQHQVTAGIHDTQLILEPAILSRLAGFPQRFINGNQSLQASPNPQTRLAQSFTISDNRTAERVRIWLRRIGQPSGTLTLKISAEVQPFGAILGSTYLGVDSVLGLDMPHPDPTTTLATSTALNADAIPNSVSAVDFHFPNPASLLPDTPYWLILETDITADAANHILWGVGDGAGFLAERGDSWKSTPHQAAYEVYLS